MTGNVFFIHSLGGASGPYKLLFLKASLKQLLLSEEPHKAAGAQHGHSTGTAERFSKWPNFMYTKRLNMSCFWVTGERDL